MRETENVFVTKPEMKEAEEPEDDKAIIQEEVKKVLQTDVPILEMFKNSHPKSRIEWTLNVRLFFDPSLCSSLVLH